MSRLSGINISIPRLSCVLLSFFLHFLLMPSSYAWKNWKYCQIYYYGAWSTWPELEKFRIISRGYMRAECIFPLHLESIFNPLYYISDLVTFDCSFADHFSPFYNIFVWVLADVTQISNWWVLLQYIIQISSWLVLLPYLTQISNWLVFHPYLTQISSWLVLLPCISNTNI